MRIASKVSKQDIRAHSICQCGFYSETGLRFSDTNRMEIINFTLWCKQWTSASGSISESRSCSQIISWNRIKFLILECRNLRKPKPVLVRLMHPKLNKSLRRPKKQLLTGFLQNSFCFLLTLVVNTRAGDFTQEFQSLWIGCRGHLIDLATTFKIKGVWRS